MASLFSAPKAPPKPPLVPDEKALLAAKKKSIALQSSRSGRASTILSSTERLGN
jgi:hypothetical protein